MVLPQPLPNVALAETYDGLDGLHKSVVRFEKKSSLKTSFKSFEFTDVLLRHSSDSLPFVIFYRPQTMADKSSSTANFFEEFPTLLEALVTAPGSLLMVGDFNFHVEDATDGSEQRFLRLLEAFNLKQHIWVPSHRSGHTLGLIITRADESMAQGFNVYDPVIAVHFPVSCSLVIPKKALERKQDSNEDIGKAEQKTRELERRLQKTRCIVSVLWHSAHWSMIPSHRPRWPTTLGLSATIALTLSDCSRHLINSLITLRNPSYFIMTMMKLWQIALLTFLPIRSSKCAINCKSRGTMSTTLLIICCTTVLNLITSIWYLVMISLV